MVGRGDGVTLGVNDDVGVMLGAGTRVSVGVGVGFSARMMLSCI